MNYPRFYRDPNPMEKESCLTLNTQFRDVRLSAVEKLNQLKTFISTIEEYQKQHAESDLTELKLSLPFDYVKNYVAKVDNYDPKMKYVFIRTTTNEKWISSWNGQQPICTFGDRDGEVPLGWEVFGIEEVTGEAGKVAIKSRGKYLSSEIGEAPMTCNRQQALDWEYFELIEHGDNIYSIKGNNGKYVSYDGKQYLMCNAEAIGDSEKFFLHPVKDLADEINIGFDCYDAHFTNLFTQLEAATEEKKQINPEDYYISNDIEVYHDGCGYGKPYVTTHPQKIFIQKDFKEAMKKADEEIYKVENAIRRDISALRSLIWHEKSIDDEASNMLKKLMPTICILEGKPIPVDEDVAAKNESDEDVEEEESDADSYIVC
jgi:predicted heme/steroid binding protein